MKHWRRLGTGLAVAALAFTSQPPHAPCAADPPPVPERALDPEDRVSFAWSASDIREAAGLLAGKLGLQVLVAEPRPDVEAAPGPADRSEAEKQPTGAPARVPAPVGRPAGADAAPGSEGGPGPRRTAAHPISFRCDRQPLEELLDAMAHAFGYAWEEAQGIYVFRPRESHGQAGQRILDEVRARDQDAPTRKELDALCAHLDELGIGPEGTPMGRLDPDSQALVRGVLQSHVVADLMRSLASIDSARQSLSRTERMTFESFARDGKVYIGAPDVATAELRFLVPSPDKQGEWVSKLWRRTDFNRAPKPGAGQGGAR